jgi:hypothetical protein
MSTAAAAILASLNAGGTAEALKTWQAQGKSGEAEKEGS